jgi:hypothetical protein
MCAALNKGSPSDQRCHRNVTGRDTRTAAIFAKVKNFICMIDSPTLVFMLTP